MLFSVYLYDIQNKLLASRSGDCADRLRVKLIHLLENFPIGTVGVIYDHHLDEVVGSYTRRIIE